MPSKKSKPTRKAQPRSQQARPSKRPSPAKSRTSAWKEERAFSEAELPQIAASLAVELQPGDRVLLEGPMGVGKTTFSRHLLLALGVEQPPEGSPTFAIAHEYNASRSGVVHVDLYRIRSEEEIDERGLPDYYWDSKKIVLSEWTSMWPRFEEQVLRSGRNWRVFLEMSEQGAEYRSVRITRPS